MKTRDLIAQLQAADPSGDLECVIGCDDIYFVQPLPMYYDGRPWLLVHDEALRGKAYSIVGLRYPSGGRKVSITTQSAEDVLSEAPDAPIDCEDASRPYVEGVRAKVKARLAEWDREDAEHVRPSK